MHGIALVTELVGFIWYLRLFGLFGLLILTELSAISAISLLTSPSQQRRTLGFQLRLAENLAEPTAAPDPGGLAQRLN